MSAPVTISDASPAPVDGAPPHVTLPALYNVFFWIGLFSFGGGLLPWIQREIVTARGWMRNEDFLPGVAMAQILPGVNSVNMAVYTGQRLRGLSGATVAVLGMLTGPFVVMIAAAILGLLIEAVRIIAWGLFVVCLVGFFLTGGLKFLTRGRGD